MKQMTTATLEEQILHVKAVYNFIEKYVCFVKDRDQRFEMARSKLERFDTTRYTDCTIMIADFQELLKKCECWAGGSFELAYDSMQRVLLKCTVSVLDKIL
jgi:hypothetical protein